MQEEWDPRVVGAAIVAAISLLIGILNIYLNFLRYTSESSLSRNTEDVIKTILTNSKQRFVSLRLISHYLGGFKENELRQQLVRAGAVRFADPNEVEVWILLNRLSRAEKRDLQLVKVPPNDDPPPYQLFSSEEEAPNDRPN